MNIEYYRAEVDYRREQVLRARRPFRIWRRTRSAAASTGRAAR